MINPAGIIDSFDDLDHVLRVEELYLLQRVAQKINSILDLDVLLDQIVSDVADTSSSILSLLGDVTKFTVGTAASDDVTVVMIAAK